MSDYDFTCIDPHTFEKIATAVSRAVLGAGVQLFSAGPDAGRDAYFRGEAPYPSDSDRWAGVWYIQAKCFSGTIGKDPQKWLRTEISKELKRFEGTGARTWPDNWVIITNVDPSGGKKGTFEYALAAIDKRRAELAPRFAIWGPKMLVAAVDEHPLVAARYRHFITPGHVLDKLIANIEVDRPSLDVFVRSLTADRIKDFEKARLEQAGLYEDSPPLHDVFVDLPFAHGNIERPTGHGGNRFNVCEALASTLAANHVGTPDSLEPKYAHRSPVWLIKGGPGQGKTTIGQYFAQVHRAAICQTRYPHSSVHALASEVATTAKRHGVYPANPRLPLAVELKDYSKWREAATYPGVLSYLAHTSTAQVQQPITVGQLRAWLPHGRWLVLFDGLDEVPQASKDAVAREILSFLDEFRPSSDLAAVFTTRPQGYAGQFDSAPEAAHIELLALEPHEALACAELLVRYRRTHAEQAESTEILREAMQSDSIRSLLSSPLHAHIMAILVRGGVSPPQRKWQLFSKFYEVIYNREVGKRLAEHPVLGRYSELVRLVHDNLGFVLHARAELSVGSAASLSRVEFNQLVYNTVEEKLDSDVDTVAASIAKAATERLVLISTPVEGSNVRFDIRQLQEFFAATVLMAGRQLSMIEDRVSHLVEDAHWREPVLFLLSGLAIGNERDALRAALSAIRSRTRDDDSALNDYAFAFAAGPRLTFQLAQDGALEIDRQVRSEFSDLFTTLLDPRSLVSVEYARIRGKQTSAWAVRLALDWIRRHPPDANYQAMRLLAALLTNDDAEVEQCKGLLSRASGLCRSAQERLARGGSCHRWHNELIADVVINGGEEHVREVISFIEAITWHEINDQAIEAILELMPDEERRVFRYVSSRRNGVQRSPPNEVLETLGSVRGKGAIWSKVEILLRYDIDEDVQAFREVIRIDSECQILRSDLNAGLLVPRCHTGRRESYEKVASLDAREYQEFVARVKGGLEPLWQIRASARSLGEGTVENATGSTAVDLLGMFAAYPLEFGARSRPVGWDTLVTNVRALIAEQPGLGATLSPSAWGLVVDSEEMQEAMVQASVSSHDHEQESYAFHVFPVQGGRAGYERLLVPLARAGARVASMSELRELHFLSRDMRYAATMKACFTDKQVLDEIANDDLAGGAERAFALLIWLVHDKNAASVPGARGRVERVLAQVSLADELVWIGIALLLDEVGIAQAIESRRAIGRFLRDGRMHYTEVWEGVFAKWREASCAPFSGGKWEHGLSILELGTVRKP